VTYNAAKTQAQDDSLTYRTTMYVIQTEPANSSDGPLGRFAVVSDERYSTRGLDAPVKAMFDRGVQTA
jgi:hypothetical protein